MTQQNVSPLDSSTTPSRSGFGLLSSCGKIGHCNCDGISEELVNPDCGVRCAMIVAGASGEGAVVHAAMVDAALLELIGQNQPENRVVFIGGIVCGEFLSIADYLDQLLSSSGKWLTAALTPEDRRQSHWNIGRLPKYPCHIAR